MDFYEHELKRYMERCIELARQCDHDVWKPHVGSLVVSREREIVGEGHKTLLENTSYVMHAERIALDRAGGLAKGSYLFTTLEPCVRVRNSQVFCSCCKLIVEKGIDTVIIGLADNSPSVNSGQGIHYLKEHGVNVKRYSLLNAVIENELMPRMPHKTISF